MKEDSHEYFDVDFIEVGRREAKKTKAGRFSRPDGWAKEGIEAKKEQRAQLATSEPSQLCGSGVAPGWLPGGSGMANWLHTRLATERKRRLGGRATGRGRGGKGREGEWSGGETTSGRDSIPVSQIRSVQSSRSSR